MRWDATLIMIIMLIVFSTTLYMVIQQPPQHQTNAVKSGNQVYGIDVSHYQGDIDWNQVYADGDRFAFAKATESTDYVDDYFTQNMENGHAAGLYMGAYHFARPNTPVKDDAIAEADHFVNVIMPYIKDGYLVPALDLENGSYIGWENLSMWVNYFCGEVFNKTGVKPIVYTAPYYAKYLDFSVTQWDLWIANYGVSSPDTGVWGFWSFWQYSDSGTVSGVSGSVDLDVYNGNLQSLVKEYVIHLNQTYSEPFYDRSGAVGYAYKWWNGRNPHYNDYSNSGGDCANFVSQALIAGGLSLWQGYDGSGGGVYSDSNGTIPYCDYLHQNLVKYQNATYAYVTSNNFSVPNWLEVGDVIIFGNASGDHWEHAALVVYRNGNDVGVAAHTADVWNKSIYDYFPSEFNMINYYHIPDGHKKIIQPFRVTATALNVRVGPSTDYQILTTIQENEVYVAYDYYIDSSGHKWWHFFLDDRNAWCAAWYTQKTNHTVFKVNVTSYLNVRSGDGIGYSVYGQVYHGMLFARIGQEYNSTEDRVWYAFWYSSDQKFSASEYTINVGVPEFPLYLPFISFIFLIIYLKRLRKN